MAKAEVKKESVASLARKDAKEQAQYRMISRREAKSMLDPFTSEEQKAVGSRVYDETVRAVESALSRVARGCASREDHDLLMRGPLFGDPRPAIKRLYRGKGSDFDRGDVYRQITSLGVIRHALGNPTYQPVVERGKKKH